MLFNHLHPLNHAVIYIASTMDAVPCLDSTPPFQVAYAQLNLLANDVKKVNAEDTLGVELIAFWLRFTIYHEIINDVLFHFLFRSQD